MVLVGRLAWSLLIGLIGRANPILSSSALGMGPFRSLPARPRSTGHPSPLPNHHPLFPPSWSQGHQTIRPARGCAPSMERSPTAKRAKPSQRNDHTGGRPAGLLAYRIMDSIPRKKMDPPACIVLFPVYLDFQMQRHRT